VAIELDHDAGQRPDQSPPGVGPRFLPCPLWEVQVLGSIPADESSQDRLRTPSFA
jgi:hypothetical protein